MASLIEALSLMSMTMITPTNDYLSIHERLLVLHKVAESTRYQDENWYREKGAGRMMGSRPDSPNLLYCHCSTKINSMHSPLFTLLLIVNLLACPIRCLSCETNSSVVVESTAKKLLCQKRRSRAAMIAVARVASVKVLWLSRLSTCLMYFARQVGQRRRVW
jgi:hypothetical protein